jgi:serine/threonine protein kinase
VSAEPFLGTPRFEVLRSAGAGGMGEVYEVFDHERRVRVALKRLPRLEARALYLFKQEFRALADVVHPNLATLYELIAHDGDWFLTMEFVDGVDFLRYVRNGPPPLSPAPGDVSGTSTISSSPNTATERRTIFLQPGSTDDLSSPPREATPAQPLDRPDQIARLRAALAQLVDGLLALHAAGKLHRDIKPSNILVTAEGRVVVLDFGLVQELAPRAPPDDEVAGTPAYMSPEQAAGRTLSPASDWYAVGVILFQALTGQRPWLGRQGFISPKRTGGARDLPQRTVREGWSFTPNAPPDLKELCERLLEHDPRARLLGPVIRDYLREPSASSPVAFQRTAPAVPQPVFIGRESQLAALGEAVARAEAGRTVIVHIHGLSGVGKSWLLQHFLDGLGPLGDVLVLTGRCYERESVPYKALDGLIDALCGYLQRLPQADLTALMPTDAGALARLFPVLRRVEAVLDAEARDYADPRELRRRAFAVLRELLTRLGQRRRLVLAIDDLQWGDVDSVPLLTDLLAAPDPPRLCLILAYRREYAATSSNLRALLDALVATEATLERREVAVEPFSGEDARQLALALLGGRTPETLVQAEAIACESGGNPYFVQEIVQYLREGHSVVPPGEGGAPFTLETVLTERVRCLPRPAQRLLEVVAVAGEPLRQREACDAAELAADDLSAMTHLRAAHLIRSTGPGDQDEIHTYHDRIRETVCSNLEPAALETCHGRLARVLEQTARADAETLAIHFKGAGLGEKAGHYYQIAGDEAARALAFQRAARLYGQALDVRPLSGAPALEVQTHLAQALANAGLPPQAGDAYRAAASLARGHSAQRLHEQAAIQYLFSGYMDEGLAELRTVFRSAGLSYPRTKTQALVEFVWRSVWLRLRGLNFDARSEAQVPTSQLLLVDLLLMAAGCVGNYDFARSLSFAVHAALLALRAGEPGRIAQTVALLAMRESTGGSGSRRRAEQSLEVAAQALGQSPSALREGTVLSARGLAAYFAGDFRGGLRYSALAEEIFRDRCTGTAFNLAVARTYMLFSLLFLGRIAELRRLAPALVTDALERGDRTFVAMHQAFVISFLHLADDAPGQARDASAQARAAWHGREFHILQTLIMLARVRSELYEGRGQAAWNYICGQWGKWTRSLNIFVQSAAIEMRYSRALCAVAAADGSPRPVAFYRRAQRDADWLERQGTARTSPMAALLRVASAGHNAGDFARAAAVEAAASAFEQEGMELYAVATRRRLGEAVGGESGRNLIRQADAWMTAQTIKNPSRLAAILVPALRI